MTAPNRGARADARKRTDAATNPGSELEVGSDVASGSTPDEREALAQALETILARARCRTLHAQSNGGRCPNCISWAKNVGVPEHLPRLAHGLAEHDARIRRETAEQIAQAVEGEYLGPDSGRQYDGTEASDAHCRNAYDEGLEIAARIARRSVEGGGER